MASLFGLSRVLEIELYDFDYTSAEVVATPTPTPTPPPAGLYEIGLPIAIGAHGEDVARVQVYLNDIAYFHPEHISTLHTDGIFGPITEGAVSGFQNLVGLYPNGVIDLDTWYMILRARENPEALERITHTSF